jgi:hypothetical protein
MRISKYIIAGLLVLAIGVFGGWLVFREPQTLLHSSHTNTTLSVYSYYLNRSGEEVLHGWSYQYRFDHGTHRESRARFVHGKSVFHEDGMEYRSDDQFGPPPTLFESEKKDPSKSP